jgi:spore coat polysaccharide biosynthesis protein SpsF
MTDDSEARRLELLWEGEFGDQYVVRNEGLDDLRGGFWHALLDQHPIASVLEVGCGQGGNLRHIAGIVGPQNVWGVDINAEARDRARRNAPGSTILAGQARFLPVPDGLVDLVFTAGVLIHQPDSSLPFIIAEIVRASRRFVLWAEYHAPENVEIPYRGERGALIKRDYGRIYRELFPELEVRDAGFLGPENGFDRVTWELLEKPQVTTG